MQNFNTDLSTLHTKVDQKVGWQNQRVKSIILTVETDSTQLHFHWFTSTVFSIYSLTVEVLLTASHTFSIPDPKNARPCRFSHVIVARVTSAYQVEHCSDKFYFKAFTRWKALVAKPLCMGEDTRFLNRNFAAHSQSAVSCADRHCQGVESQQRYADREGLFRIT